jgi:uroporphyrinogen III methyltransferase/synthase
MTQQQINDLLMLKALQGKKVVRLKGGDPFVFGRGGEEAQAVTAAGIAFEVVPGVTAAIAAPAYAGIPVTHRELNSSFTVVTGHQQEEKNEGDTEPAETEDGSDIDWWVLAKLPCLAFYMGVQSLPRISQRLINHGMDPATPAATIQWGTTPRQRTVVATLADLPQRVQEAALASPAITIIGPVVNLRQSLNWFESRPLFAQTVVVTRTRQQQSDLSAALAALGARVIQAPAIELHPPKDFTQVDRAILNSARFDWVIFTSVNGVSFTRKRLAEIGKDARIFGNAKIAAIGQPTAQAIARELCLKVDLCPGSFVAEALGQELASRRQIAGKRFLLLRADIARPVLNQMLQENRAADINDVAIYRTRPAGSLPPEFLQALQAGRINWITFTSSSTAKNFFRLLGKDPQEQVKNVKLASIGPVTTATLKELGFEATVQAEKFTIEGLVEAMVKAVKQ